MNVRVFIVTFCLSGVVLAAEMCGLLHVSPETIGHVLGKKFACRLKGDLMKVAVFDEIVEESKKKLTNAKNAKDIKQYLHYRVLGYFTRKHEEMQKGWCKRFDQLLALPQEWIEDEMEEAQDYLTLLLFLELGGVGYKDNIFSQEKPHTMSDCYRMRLLSYQRKSFLFLLEEEYTIMDRLIAMATNQHILLFPEYRGTSEDEKLISTFLGALYREEHRMQNEDILNSMCDGLYQSLAQGFLNLAREHWSTSGFSILLLGFKFMQDLCMSALVWYQQEMLRASMLTWSRETKVTHLGDDCYDMLCEIFKRPSGKQDGQCDMMTRELYEMLYVNFEKKLKDVREQYIYDASADLSKISIKNEQKRTRCALQVSWSLDNVVEADFQSYQRLVTKILHYILRSGEFLNVRKKVLSVVNYNVLKKKTYFSITDTAIHCQYDPPNDGFCVSLPLLEKVEKMTDYDRKFLLVRLLQGQGVYLHNMPPYKYLPPKEPNPCEKNFMDLLPEYCEKLQLTPFLAQEPLQEPRSSWCIIL